MACFGHSARIKGCSKSIADLVQHTGAGQLSAACLYQLHLPECERFSVGCCNPCDGSQPALTGMSAQAGTPRRPALPLQAIASLTAQLEEEMLAGAEPAEGEGHREEDSLCQQKPTLTSGTKKRRDSLDRENSPHRCDSRERMSICSCRLHSTRYQSLRYKVSLCRSKRRATLDHEEQAVCQLELRSSPGQATGTLRKLQWHRQQPLVLEACSSNLMEALCTFAAIQSEVVQHLQVATTSTKSDWTQLCVSWPSGEQGREQNHTAQVAMLRQL